MVIWLTGLSGAGKTSLAEALYQLLKPRLPELVLLDGDAVRAAFGNDLAYAEDDREIQIRRLQNIAKLLSGQQLVVIVAAVYSRPDLLTWNRKNLDGYFEVYLETSLETVRRRDRKGLYARAERGETANVVGLDIPWRPPASPDLVINMDDPEPPAVLARRIVAGMPSLATRFAGQPA